MTRPPIVDYQPDDRVSYWSDTGRSGMAGRVTTVEWRLDPPIRLGSATKKQIKAAVRQPRFRVHWDGADRPCLYWYEARELVPAIKP